MNITDGLVRDIPLRVMEVGNTDNIFILVQSGEKKPFIFHELQWEIIIGFVYVFLSSSYIFPEYNIYSLNFWEKLPDMNPGLAIKGRACLGLKDQDPRMNRIRGTVIFNAATVNMKTKYDVRFNLFLETVTHPLLICTNFSFSVFLFYCLIVLSPSAATSTIILGNKSSSHLG